jgi:Family of unknown function (DUF6011)
MSVTTKTEYEIKVRQFVTKFNDNPMPARIMYGFVEAETPKAYKIDVRMKPNPTSTCMRCGRELTHPVSLMFGLGPECSGMYYDHPFTEEYVENNFEEIRQKLAEVKWSGWIPKSGLEYMEEVREVEVTEEKPKPKKETKGLKAVQKPQKEDDKYKLEIDENLINKLYNELVTVL